LINC